MNPPSTIASSDYLIETDALTLQFKRKLALDGLTLKVARGGIHAVFGLPCLASMMIMYPHRSTSRAPAKAAAQPVVAV